MEKRDILQYLFENKLQYHLRFLYTNSAETHSISTFCVGFHVLKRKQEVWKLIYTWKFSAVCLGIVHPLHRVALGLRPICEHLDVICTALSRCDGKNEACSSSESPFKIWGSYNIMKQVNCIWQNMHFHRWRQAFQISLYRGAHVTLYPKF